MKTQRNDGLALQLLDIDKRFGGVHALRGAHLEVKPGEIMGLCGENGAGKSTLLKILAGVHPSGSYTGSVIVDGRPRRLSGPADARRAGIAVVYQELTLVPELTVAQNLLLGREPGRFGFVDHARLEAIAREDLARFGFADRIDVSKPVQELGIGLQQIVEIVRALPQSAQILVLDEPTAALTEKESAELLGWLRTLRDRGTTCVYVSHRLDEIFALCDRVTVLRDGRTTATLVTREVTPEQVVAEMVGRSIAVRVRARTSPLADKPPILEVEDFRVNRVQVGKAATLANGTGAASHPAASAPGATRDTAPAAAAPLRPFVVDGVSLSLRPGEIVAICGAMGSGRTALLSSLFGCARAGTSGTVRVGGEVARLESPIDAIKKGIAFLPEDRKGRGIVPFMTVGQNLALPSLASAETMGGRARLGLVDKVAETQLAERRIRALRIRGDADAPIVTLSGGNQQKVVLGKWLEKNPRVFLLDEPTRGVDVGAREEIYGILEDLATQGMGILFASSDLVEVLRLARRILVLRDGRFVGELDGATATEQAIVQLSTGALAAPVSSAVPSPSLAAPAREPRRATP